MELIFNPCGEFQWSPEGPVSQIHSPHVHVGAPGIFSVLLRSVQMLKGEWSAESNGKLPHLFIPSKTAILVPAFAVKDLPLGRTFWCDGDGDDDDDDDETCKAADCGRFEVRM